jgi:hypothetical protein
MDYQFNVEVVLVTVAPNIEKPGDTKILIKGARILALPREYPNQPILLKDLANKVLMEYTGIDTKSWKSISLVDIPVIQPVYENHHIIIPFGCMIPATTHPLKDSKWMNLVEIYTRSYTWECNDELEIIKKVCLYI